MKNRKFGVAMAALAAAALTLSACSGTGSPSGDKPAPVATGGETVPGSQVTVMWNQALYSYNSDTSEANATANNNILYMTRAGFVYYGAGSKLVKNELFGTVEKTSDDPLTVKYTVNEGVKWSDGTPVSAADMILSWAAQSTLFNTVKPEQGEDGKVTNQEAVNAGVYFDSASPAMQLITKFPEIGDNGRSVTLVYDKPRADWEVAFSIGVPAHVTAMKALGLTEAKDAGQKLIDAFKNKDTAALSKIAKFWNTGFNFESMPDDKSLALSSGAYILTNYVEGQYLTLTANKDYTWGPKPQVETIVVRYNGDPLAGVNAMQNGEVNIIQPQATVDTLTALKAIQGVKLSQDPTATYEHVDLIFSNGGPFDAKSYGGDAAKALAVRKAFLTCVPRGEILDKLIKPLDANAKLRESYVLSADNPNYAKVVEANGMASTFGTGDPAKAKEILTNAGFDTAKPIAVRFLYASNNERRVQQYQLISASCNQAGFNVVDNGDPKWGSRLNQNASYDASMFGWQSTNTYVLNAEANFVTGGQNNFAGYSNPEVDQLWAQLVTNIDTAKEAELVGKMEAQLAKDAFGVTLYQHPGITAWTSTVDGVSDIPIAPTMFWNYWDWKIKAEDVIK